jgi:hypothetical protein
MRDILRYKKFKENDKKKWTLQFLAVLYNSIDSIDNIQTKNIDFEI